MTAAGSAAAGSYCFLLDAAGLEQFEWQLVQWSQAH